MGNILAFESGCTKTRVGLFDSQGSLIAEVVGEGTNPFEYGEAFCVNTLISLGSKLLEPDATVDTIVAGIAGVYEYDSRKNIAGALCDLHVSERVIITDDKWPLLYANVGDSDGIIVIAGTGSAVLAQSGDGKSISVGGRGSFIGDEGSAFSLAHRALKAAAHSTDGIEPETTLTDALMNAVGSHDFVGLVRWIDNATKKDIARLARVVTTCAEGGDKVAIDCLRKEASSLSNQVVAAYQQLSLPNTTPVYLVGGLLEGSDQYRDLFRAILYDRLHISTVEIAPLRSHHAVFRLAMAESFPKAVSAFNVKDFKNTIIHAQNSEDHISPTEEKLQGPTLDQLSEIEIVRRMNDQDLEVIDAVAQEEDPIAEAIEKIAMAFSSGGRLIYVGAGTSGRLGILDASECPPTFGASPEKVQGIIAGGDLAIRISVEGAEDDTLQAVADLDAIDPPVCEKDIVAGITASGYTPYVCTALEEAAKRDAETILICCNPACRGDAAIVIAMNTGAETLTGSTRLKAGTATKLVLNMLTTGAMALSGHMYNGLMVGMKPVNAKLRRRAISIVSELTGLSANASASLLQEAEDNIAVAVIMSEKKVDCLNAKQMLNAEGGSLRGVIG